MRKCVGCQEMKSKKEMIRVIRTSEENFYWMQQEERTDAVLISARTVTALQKQ